MQISSLALLALGVIGWTGVMSNPMPGLTTSTTTEYDFAIVTSFVVCTTTVGAATQTIAGPTYTATVPGAAGPTVTATAKATTKTLATRTVTASGTATATATKTTTMMATKTATATKTSTTSVPTHTVAPIPTDIPTVTTDFPTETGSAVPSSTPVDPAVPQEYLLSLKNGVADKDGFRADMDAEMDMVNTELGVQVNTVVTEYDVQTFVGYAVMITQELVAWIGNDPRVNTFDPDGSGTLA